MDKKKKRIAFVNQRYGLDVNGGSEYYTRQLAEHLKDIYDVEVLTTKALKYDTWENYYKQDVEKINGIVVRRFDVAKIRDVLGMERCEKLWRRCPIMKKRWEAGWIDAQGPYSPELIQYIHSHSKDYELFIFVTYLYYHTVKGLPEVSDRAVLIPTAHDEPYIYFHTFRDVFSKAQALVYLTPEEKMLVERLFSVKKKPSCVCGVGVEPVYDIDNARYREKYNIDQEYIIYVGRLDASKGCLEMFRIFQIYKANHQDCKMKLVLMGKSVIDIPDDEDIIYQGFVSEKDKFDAISGAKVLWLPSQYESLSIAVLEAMSLGVPVLVNGKCEVLKGHCERSKAGFFYYSEEEAEEYLSVILDTNKMQTMSENAKRYISENYQWDNILRELRNLFENMRPMRQNE